MMLTCMLNSRFFYSLFFDLSNFKVIVEQRGWNGFVNLTLVTTALGFMLLLLIFQTLEVS